MWFVSLGDEPIGSEPAFDRPVLVVQDDLLNDSRLGTVMVAPLTSNLQRARAFGSVLLRAKQDVVERDSVVLVCQVVALDKSRFGTLVGTLTRRQMQDVDRGLALALGLSPKVG